MGNSRSIGVAYSDQELSNSGTVLVNTSLGFTNKNSGSVTQLTSKSTPVTLNAPCGVIVTNNALLAGNTSVVFTFNNSFINAKSTVVLNLKSTGITDRYYFSAINTADGLCQIRIKNILVSNGSDALSINFTILNGNN